MLERLVSASARRRVAARKPMRALLTSLAVHVVRRATFASDRSRRRARARHPSGRPSSARPRARPGSSGSPPARPNVRDRVPRLGARARSLAARSRGSWSLLRQDSRTARERALASCSRARWREPFRCRRCRPRGRRVSLALMPIDVERVRPQVVAGRAPRRLRVLRGQRGSASSSWPAIMNEARRWVSAKAFDRDDADALRPARRALSRCSFARSRAALAA